MAKSTPFIRHAPGEKWSQYIDGKVVTKTISKVDYDPKEKVWSILFEVDSASDTPHLSSYPNKFNNGHHYSTCTCPIGKDHAYDDMMVEEDNAVPD